jgi:hypothetical protein
VFFISFFIVSQSSCALDLDLTNTTLAEYEIIVFKPYRKNEICVGTRNQMELYMNKFGENGELIPLCASNSCICDNKFVFEKILSNNNSFKNNDT